MPPLSTSKKVYDIKKSYINCYQLTIKQSNVWQNPNDLDDENDHFKQPLIAIEKWKDCKWHKNMCTKNATYTKKYYVHEIAVVNLSKIYFLKNAKKTCKPNKRDLNCDWKKKIHTTEGIFWKLLFKILTQLTFTCSKPTI